MIGWIVEVVTKWLSLEGITTNDEQEMVAFAVRSLIFGILPILIAMSLGLMFSMFYEGFLIILPFFLIRKFSGGYHSKSPYLCIIFSIVLIAVGLGMIRMIYFTEQFAMLKILVFLSATSLFIFSPISSDARKLTFRERRFLGTISKILSIIAVISYLILDCLGMRQTSVPIGVGVFITALLQWPCIIISATEK